MIKKLKWFWQRHTRGWDDRDLWNLDYTIAKFTLPRLKEFRKNIFSYPGGFETAKEWEVILDKMIFALEHIVNDGWEFNPTYDFERNKKINDKISEGLELFGRYFRSLWN